MKSFSKLRSDLIPRSVQAVILRVVEASMWLLAALAVVSVVVQYGFYLSNEQQAFFHHLDMVIITVFILETLVKLFLSPSKKSFLKQHIFEIHLIAMFIGLYIFFGYAARFTMNMVIILGQVYLLGIVTLRSLRLNHILADWKISPPKLVACSFVLVISVGTLILMLPKSTPTESSIPLIDALFTSTSAVCVTGLTVLDTDKGFTLGGKITIMLLIQVGGLGLMTLSAAFALLTGMGLGLKERSVLQSVVSTDDFGSIGKLAGLSFVLTLAIESIGAALLMFSFVPQFGFVKGAFYSCFHSVSAFCNAGFALFTDNLEPYYNDCLLSTVIMSLIVLGGIGFPVMVELLSLSTWRRPQRRVWRRFSMHTRLVLLTTAVLIFGGAAFLYFYPAPGIASMVEWQGARKVVGCLFQSITTRTAGFNSVRICAFGQPTVIIIIILMFIGASPCSTGGGIKTTTIAVLFLKVRSIFKSQPYPEIWSRRIPSHQVETAAMVLLLALTIVAVSVTLMAMTEDATFLELVFEEVSALSTVGLSLGITPKLTCCGKLVLIASMLIGRIGSITLLLSLTQHRRKTDYDLPEETVLIG